MQKSSMCYKTSRLLHVPLIIFNNITYMYIYLYSTNIYHNLSWHTLSSKVKFVSKGDWPERALGVIFNKWYLDGYPKLCNILSDKSSLHTPVL